MTEADPVERVDDFSGNVGDGLASAAPGRSGTSGLGAANSPWVSAGVRSRSNSASSWASRR